MNQTMPNTTPDQKEIILAKENEILDAMRNGDIDALDRLIHDDLVFNIPNGQTTNKAMDIDPYRNGNMEVDSIESGEQVMSLIGDNATVSVMLKMKGRFMKQPFEGNFRVLRVWKEIDQEWKIIAGSSILV